VTGPHRRPTKDELGAAYGTEIPDVIAPGLDVLFVGINPGLYSGATGHHFARPGNRFWPALHLSGFTDRVLHPSEQEELLSVGLGITNLVARATASAAELTDEEIRTAVRRIRAKVGRYRPRRVAFLGIGTYRIAFGRKDAVVGPQETRIGDARVWALPNPSGLNAHYQLPDLARVFRELRREVHSKG
jgi:TDG/mug DNA glycosylase family protein